MLWAVNGCGGNRAVWIHVDSVPIVDPQPVDLRLPHGGDIKHNREHRDHTDKDHYVDHGNDAHDTDE